MSTKFVEIATTDARLFVKAILALGAQGATIPENVGVRKGVLMSTKLEIDEDVVVAESPIVRVLPQEKKKDLKPEVKPEVKAEPKVVAQKPKQSTKKDIDKTGDEEKPPVE